MRTSCAPEGRTLAHVSHLQGAMTLFLCLATAKGYAMLYTMHEACNVGGGDADVDQSRCAPLRWITCVVVGAFGYVTYVAMLAYQRLAQHYTVAGAADAAVASLVAAARARRSTATETRAGADGEQGKLQERGGEFHTDGGDTAPEDGGDGGDCGDDHTCDGSPAKSTQTEEDCGDVAAAAAAAGKLVFTASTPMSQDLSASYQSLRDAAAAHNLAVRAAAETNAAAPSLPAEQKHVRLEEVSTQTSIRVFCDASTSPRAPTRVCAV